jgi:uncharacterized protein
VSLFSKQAIIPCSAQQLFAFHAEPQNLTVVMPPTLKLLALETDGPAEEGRLIQIHVRDWGVFPMRWTCRWEKVQAPHLLVDAMVKGPFWRFRHEHHFLPIGPAACLMQDRIDYAWGRSFWGQLVSETAVRVYLHLLFGYRHRQTCLWAEKQVKTAAE